jgi:shikimate dehydrogenase
VVLTGFRGTGKSAVGRCLSFRLGLPLFETDRMIEEESGESIPAIFASRGEAHFRALERGVVAGLPADNCVVSTGGGAVLDPVNVAAIRRGSTVFLLTADPQTIEARTLGSNRPPLTTLPPSKEIAALLAKRKNSYLAAADFCLDTTGRTPGESADALLSLLEGGDARGDDSSRAMAFLAQAAGTVSSRTGHLTRRYAVIGSPSRHSRGPVLYTHLFAKYGIDATYTWVEWPDLARILTNLWHLDFRGISVTIPFKEGVVQAVDEPDDDVIAIGAANTVLFCCGTTYAFNTDWIGVREPLVHCKGGRAVVVGAGGAAAAAVYALLDLGMDVKVANRTYDRGEQLATRMGCRAIPLQGIGSSAPDVIVNATPVGMAPDTAVPFDTTILTPDMTVFDLVYTPPDTPLIRAARARGCRAIPGTEMFIHQARAQFRHFTGIDLSPDEMRGVI